MGNIVTFYSFKGGTGRSMALANVGYLLSSWGFKVLMVDWDLEAPGLHNFFKELFKNDLKYKGPGIVDLLSNIKGNNKVTDSNCCNWEPYVIDLQINNNNLYLLPAGEEDADYYNRVRSIDFNNLYVEYNAGILFEQLRNEWKDCYDFILIDSRTGITDIGGVCTIQMPDILVLLFTATAQSLNGVYNVARRANDAQKKLISDRLRLVSLPIPSRFDSTEEFKISQEWIERFSEKLQPIYENWLPTSIKTNDMLEATKIPYSTYFSFGEKLAVIEQSRRDSGGLSYSYENLAALIANDLENVELLVDDRDRYVHRATKTKNRSNIHQNRIFISYSRKDQELLEKLKRHLSVLEKSDTFTVWSDSNITAGHSWYSRLQDEIDKASIVILVVSADYLASDFIMREELSYILDKGIDSKLRVIPIIAGPCMWKKIPLFEKLQVFPIDGSPLYSLKSHELDQQLFKLTKIITQSQDDYDISNYIMWIKERCSNMDVAMLSKQPIIVGLLDLFVPLYAEDPDLAFNRKKMLNVGEQQNIHYSEENINNLINIEDLIFKNDYLLIEGDPVSGKTTLSKKVAIDLAYKYGQKEFILPVLIFLRDLKDADTIIDREEFKAEKLLEIYFKKFEMVISIEVIIKYCLNKKVLFLIDGLDEVPSQLCNRIVEAFATFRVKYGVQMVLLGRREGIIGEAIQWFGKKHVRIHSFNEDQINLFVKLWCEHVLIKRPAEGWKIAKDLCGELQTHQEVKFLIENPLMLTTICILYYEGEKLPEQRAELYRKFVENLVRRRFYEPDRILEILKGFGFTMQERGEKGIGRNDALAIVKKTYRPIKEEDTQEYNRRIAGIFDDFALKSGILRLEEGNYRFWHLTFQEYLAAEHLIASSDDLVQAIEPYLTNEQYKETVRLYIGCLSLNQKSVAAKIIRNILECDDIPSDQLILACESLIDIKKARRDELVVSKANERLWQEIDKDSIGVAIKMIYGDIIGWLGDKRDLRQFIMIEGGKYILESLGERNITTFEMGKHLVTNSWFAEFVDDGGYRNLEFWTVEGRKWLEYSRETCPRFWHQRIWNCPNKPVVGVNWWEANAFCKWLSINRGDGFFRLSSEDEWQAAAAGKEARNYPWGKDWDANKCNCENNKTGQTSCVGIFKLGATPAGIEDMGGNVWEWCSSGYYENKDITDFMFDAESYDAMSNNNWGKFKEKIESKKSGCPVLRGGSFENNEDDMLCSKRIPIAPCYRHNNIGFRCIK